MKGKTIIILIALIISQQFCNGQWSKTKEYIEQYKGIAMLEMRRSGVPASITLAQGILESGSGQGKLCKKSNNHFGIKCKTEWTGEKVYHNDDLKGECFRSYPNPEESFKDHSDFLKTRKHYAFLFELDPKDYQSWARGLKKAGYATESDYPQNLIKMIEENNLQQYTLMVLEGDSTGTEKSDSIMPSAKTNFSLKDSAHNMKDSSKTIPQPKLLPTDSNRSPIKSNNGTDSLKPSIPKPEASLTPSIEKTFLVNNTKAVYVEEGTSLLSIATKHGVDLSKLLAFNDLMDSTEICNKDGIIFLEKKQLRGEKDIYILDSPATLYEVGQKSGVKVSKLEEYNKLHQTTILPAGTKVYLKPNTL